MLTTATAPARAWTRRTCLTWGLALAAPLGLSACLGGGPQATVEGFYAAVAQGDVDKAMTWLALEQQEEEAWLPPPELLSLTRLQHLSIAGNDCS